MPRLMQAFEPVSKPTLSLGAVSFLMRLCPKLVSLACFISRHFRGVARLFCAVFLVALARGFLRQPPKSVRFSKSSFCSCAKLPLGCVFGPDLLRFIAMLSLVQWPPLLNFSDQLSGG